MSEYKLFGVEMSPYSVKVRSVLRYKGIPHQWVVRSMDRMAEFGQYAKLPLVPCLACPDGTGLQDSTPIIEALQERHPEPSIHLDDPLADFVSVLLEECAAGGAEVRTSCQIEAVRYSGRFAVETSQGVFESRALGDLDADGELDLVVSQFGDAFGQFLVLFPGLGNGLLGAYSTIQVGYDPFDVELADFDGDGRLDLVTASNYAAQVVLVRGSDMRRRPDETRYGAGDFPRGLASGDFDGDGRLDLAVANAGSNDVTVLFQE